MRIDGGRIVAAARAYLGVPFLHQGRSRLGLDCGGLLIAVARDLDIDIVEPGVYSMSPDPALVAQALARNCIRVADVQPGDALLFSFAGEPRHVGLATDIGVIHAWAGPGKVVEHRLDAAWRRRLKSTWRIQ